MITPDDINARGIEYVLMGKLIHERDNDTLAYINPDIFADKEIKEMYAVLRKNGIPSFQMAEQMFRDYKDGYLYPAFTEAIDKVKTECSSFFKKKTATDDYIDALEDKRTGRLLARLTLDVDAHLRAGTDVSEIIRTMEKTLEGVYTTNSYKRYTDVLNKITNKLTEAPLVGVPTGLKHLDNVSGGLVRGNLVSVGGWSANLKSTNTLYTMLSILKTNPVMRGIYFQIEMTFEDMVRMLLGQLGLNRTDLLKGEIGMDEIVNTLQKNALLTLGQLKIYGSDDNTGTFPQIEKIIRRERPDVWCIDYMGQLIVNEFPDSKSSGEHHIHYMQTIHALKALAQYTKSIGILVHQVKPREMKSYGKQKTDPRPKMTDIEWAQDIYRLSGYVYMCYYPCKYFRKKDPDWNRVFIQIWDKMRYADSTFNILEVDPVTGIFFEPCSKISNMGKAHWMSLEKETQIIEGEIML